MCAAMGIMTNGSSPPAATPRRQFRLLDAMILVAAAAIGCGVILCSARVAKRTPYDWYSELVREEYDELAICGKILLLCLLTMPLVATVTLALIPIRLVGTSSSFRRLARQPGLMASCASGVTIAFIGLPVLVGALAAGASWDGVWRMLADEEEIYSATMYGGLAVFVSWMTLFVGGRWRAERSWIDRFGRAMGLSRNMAAIALWADFYIF